MLFEVSQVKMLCERWHWTESFFDGLNFNAKCSIQTQNTKCRCFEAIHTRWCFTQVECKCNDHREQHHHQCRCRSWCRRCRCRRTWRIRIWTVATCAGGILQGKCRNIVCHTLAWLCNQWLQHSTICSRSWKILHWTLHTCKYMNIQKKAPITGVVGVTGLCIEDL